ncbi:MAG: hypothetical protein HY820_24515 [Acidobacteria bacterium]|nr:hypothetical protein [Acidobacteriota bacterium]
MQRQWITTILAAALCTTAAMAQELKATIPFDFSASQKQMPAGTYTVSRMPGSGGSFVAVFRNVVTRKSAAVLAASELDRNESAGRTAKLVFACTSGKCALAEMHAPGITNARRFVTPAPMAGEREHLVSVAFRSPRTGSGF